MNNTVDQEEIEKFTKISNQWWEVNGKFKPLHKFNPTRISYVKDKLLEYFSLNKGELKPLSTLKILDVGCGGGLLCEPLKNLGANITGIDAGKENIEIAKIHAQENNLEIDYRHIDVEDLAKTDEKFDVVLAMEVLEHVADIEKFMIAAKNCLKADGLLFTATLNRTAKSYLSAIVGAEYLLRWLPRGTHDWKKFLKPSQISKIAAHNDLELLSLDGFSYNLLKDSWKITNDLSINYVMVFKKTSVD